MSRVIKFQALDESTNIMHDIETQSEPSDGRGAHNFKGYEKRNGYVARKMLSHPNSDGRGYMLEHRLVIEEKLGRLLCADEIVHHSNHIRDDNRLENLEVLTDQKRHAAGHAASKDRDEKSKRWTADPKLASKKFRLFNRDTGLMEIKNLSQLINTTFRRGKFEYRGESTGLQDKNRVDIYEGDVVKSINNKHYWLYVVGTSPNFGGMLWALMYENNLSVCGIQDVYTYKKQIVTLGSRRDFVTERVEVIGNIHQNPELLNQ